MKNMWKLILVLLIIATISASNIYAIAKEIESDIVYEVDGEEVINKGEAIRVNEKIYLLSQDIEMALGVDIQIKGKLVNMRSQADTTKEKGEVLHLEKAKVVNVDIGQKEIILLPYSVTEEKGAYITLKIDEETEIFYEEIEKLVPINMIEKDMVISLKYDVLPEENGQKNYRAIEIIIKENNSISTLDTSIIEGIEIIEINFSHGYIKVAYINKEKQQLENQIIIHIDQNTNIRNQVNKLYKVEDLEIGQKIKVITNGILTTSIPPQTLGLEIIIL